jgi:hypothetical protein
LPKELTSDRYYKSFTVVSYRRNDSASVWQVLWNYKYDCKVRSALASVVNYDRKSDATVLSDDSVI